MALCVWQLPVLPLAIERQLTSVVSQFVQYRLGLEGHGCGRIPGDGVPQKTGREDGVRRERGLALVFRLWGPEDVQGAVARAA